MTKIKICGITQKKEAKYLNEVKVDYAGFVFAKSRRKVTYEQAKKIKDTLSSDIKTVGVFVNESIENIVKLSNDKIIDLIQLHGIEDVDYIKKLKKYTNLKIIKVFKIKEYFDANQNYMEEIKKYNDYADYFLFDTYSNKCEGGSGRSFNINNIDEKQIKKDFFLAGGLCKENIEDVLKIKPYAVDISSGVEIEGKKDREKIIEITNIIREFSN